MSAIYIGCDHDVSYAGASKASDGSYLNSGTCTYTLKKAQDGTTVGSGTLTYVTASDGDYTGTIESTVTSSLVAGVKYNLDVTFVKAGYNDMRREVLTAAYRT